jgi:FkbM family methyltransferase
MNRTDIYNEIKNKGLDCKNVIDVGACYGEWSTNIRQIFDNAFILGIDATDWTGNGEFSECNASEICTLYHKDNAEVIFYKTAGRNCTGDSIYRENTIHYGDNHLVKQVHKTKTLKTLCEKYNITNIDLIKLDTQGSELDILIGLGDLLDTVQFLEIECSIVEWNKGGCSFNDVIKFLENKFNIYDIVELHRIYNKDLAQIDVIFQNKNSNIKKIF